MTRTACFFRRPGLLVVAVVFTMLRCASGEWTFEIGSKPKSASEAKAPAQLVWPPPPEQPRVAFLQSISNPAQFGAKVSGLRKLANWLSGSQQGMGSFNRPFALALDEADNLCVADTGANAVGFFDQAAKRWYRWDQIGGVAFQAPVSIAKKGRTLVVADATLATIFGFDLEGKLLFRITEPVVRPSGLAISGDQLFVADSAGHCVERFDLRGKFLGRFGSRGANPGEFNFPTHVAADSRGNIYVTDSLNARIQVFDPKGDFLRQIGAPGDAPGFFSRPKGVSIDSQGHLYVADAAFDNFQIFDPEGHVLLDVGEHGSAPGEFWLPVGIAVGHDNRIFVADSYNGRIQVFKLLESK